MILDDLRKCILDRKRNPVPDSYVSALFKKGKDEMLKKIVEESVEVILASKAGARDRLISELADLWFHCMVLLEEEEVSYSDVLNELDERFRQKRK